MRAIVLMPTPLRKYSRSRQTKKTFEEARKEKAWKYTGKIMLTIRLRIARENVSLNIYTHNTHTKTPWWNNSMVKVFWIHSNERINWSGKWALHSFQGSIYPHGANCTGTKWVLNFLRMPTKTKQNDKVLWYCYNKKRANEKWVRESERERRTRERKKMCWAQYGKLMVYGTRQISNHFGTKF